MTVTQDAFLQIDQSIGVEIVLDKRAFLQIDQSIGLAIVLDQRSFLQVDQNMTRMPELNWGCMAMGSN